MTQPANPPLIETKHITDVEIRDALRAVVAEKPDYIYRAPQHMNPANEGTCYYVHTEDDDEEDLTPGCLVGCVLDRLGIPLESLREHEGDSADSVVSSYLPQASKRTLNVLYEAQNFQDRRQTWAVALREAEGFDCE